jgi:DNA recombination protein RmuC
MEQTILIILLVVIIIAIAAFAFTLNQRLREIKNSSAVELMKTDVTELTRSIANLQQNMGATLERSNMAVQTSVQKQLGESAKLVADVTHRLAKLDETNRRVVDVADELRTLQNVLQNPKQRGVFGEYYLQSVLENVMSPAQFQMQYKFKDGAFF